MHRPLQVSLLLKFNATNAIYILYLLIANFIFILFIIPRNNPHIRFQTYLGCCSQKELYQYLFCFCVEKPPP